MDLARFLGVVRRSFGLIVAVTVVVAAATFAVSSVLPRQYESEARVLVGSVTDPTIDRLNAYQQLAQTYAALATTTPVLSKAAADIGIDEDPVKLSLRVAVRAPLGQSIVRINATASSANEAANLVNAIANEVVALGRPAASGTSIASIVQPGLVPATASSPRVLLNTAVGVVLGLALGIAAALVLARRRERAVAAEAAYAAPTLGLAPAPRVAGQSPSWPR